MDEQQCSRQTPDDATSPTLPHRSTDLPGMPPIESAPEAGFEVEAELEPESKSESESESESEPESESAPAPVRRRQHRGLFWGLGILLGLSLAVVLLLRALSFEARWRNGRLEISFFGSGSDYIADAVDGQTSGQAPSSGTDGQRADPTQMPRAATGTGVTLTLSASAGETMTLQEIYRAVSPSTVSVLVQTALGEGSGSGILMSADGYLITNHHVIAEATAVTVQTDTGRQYPAALVGSDEFSDLAVLKIEPDPALDPEGFPAATFAASDGVQVGDQVVAIGDPLGVELRGSMTDGIISAISRDILVGERTMTLLQTNAALNAGNSGGPLVNLQGQVIGINTMKLSSAYVSVEGLGFAIPMDVAKPLIDELIAQGYVSGRPTLGITGQAVTAQTAAQYDLPAGVYVHSVEPNTDAARQGLQPGDIITAIEDIPVASVEELNRVKNGFRAGDTVRLTIWREGETLTLGVQLGDQAE